MADISPTQRGRTSYAHRHTPRPSSFRVVRGEAATSPIAPEIEPGKGHDSAAVRAALAHLLDSPPFRKSAQLANFLRFVVEEALAGRGGRIKAYTIATTALGRDETFDPQTDPIVRVEAARLRRALRSYYADGGAADAIMIELPTGTYAPVFRSIRPQRRTAAARLCATVRELAAFARQNRRLLLLIFVVAAAVSVTVEIIEVLLSDAIWPMIAKALHGASGSMTAGDSLR